MTGSSEYVLTGGFKQMPTGDFAGMVAKIDKADKSLTVLAVGVEATEAAILEWIGGTIRLMRSERRTDVQMPDMHARAAVISGLQ